MDSTNMRNSNDERCWKGALNEYRERDMKPEIRALEQRMNSLDLYKVYVSK